MGYLQDYLKKTVPELEKELKELLIQYRKLRKRPLFIYSSALNKRIFETGMIMDDYHVIYDFLRDVDSDEIDFYIETPGGMGEAAEEIAKLLHKNFKKVNYVVSGEAKSAGTILVLSGNEIMMTGSGSLGPIDAQMRIGRSSVSAYDYKEWVESVRKEAIKKKSLNPFDATMIAQISPGELEGVYCALDFAKKLVVEWLVKYKFQYWEKTESRGIDVTQKKKRKVANSIANKLLNHKNWGSHGRSIKIDDLEQIGLKIIKIDEDPDWSDLIYRIQMIIKFIFSNSPSFKLFVYNGDLISQKAIERNSLRRVPIPKLNVPVITQIDVSCQKCGKVYNVYAKLKNDKKIDEEMKKKGLIPYPSDDKIICSCGFEIDLLPIRNQIESETKQPFII